MSRPSPPAPSVRVDRDRPGWLPWLLGLLLLTLLAVVLFFLFAGDEEEDDDLAVEDSASQPLDEPADADADADADLDADVDTSAAPEVSADAGGGTDTSAGTAPLVLALPFPSLAGEEGRVVTASSVEVVDVPADEAFTIGAPDDELLVHLTPAARAASGGESAANVEPGSTVASLEGTLEPITEEFLRTLDLSGDEADAVRERDVYVAATAFELASS